MTAKRKRETQLHGHVSKILRVEKTADQNQGQKVAKKQLKIKSNLTITSSSPSTKLSNVTTGSPKKHKVSSYNKSKNKIGKLKPKGVTERKSPIKAVISDFKGEQDNNKESSLNIPKKKPLERKIWNKKKKVLLDNTVPACATSNHSSLNVKNLKVRKKTFPKDTAIRAIAKLPLNPNDFSSNWKKLQKVLV